MTGSGIRVSAAGQGRLFLRVKIMGKIMGSENHGVSQLDFRIKTVFKHGLYPPITMFGSLGHIRKRRKHEHKTTH